MEHSRLRVWSFGLAIVALLVASVAVAQPHPPYENHYKVYRTPLITYTSPVLLADQFNKYAVDVLTLEHWANPTEKFIPETGERFKPVDPFIHQMWWRGNFPPMEPREIIGIDQFGTDKWTLINPEYLVTPALKNVPEGKPPLWNHYLCYRALPVNLGRVVILTDQFGITTAQLIYRSWFCNPVSKQHNGVFYPIIDEKAHLACYEYPRNPMAYPVLAIDQFGQWKFDAREDFCLCVPALKEHVVKTEQSTWGKIKAMYN